MRNIRSFAMVAALLALYCCTDEGIDTGIAGQVHYGKGGCMPVTVESTRAYKGYTGSIYFVVESDLETLGDGEGEFEALKDRSLRTTVFNGTFAADLPPGTYVVFPSDFYNYSADNIITVSAGNVSHKTFRFWECTSY